MQRQVEALLETIAETKSYFSVVAFGSAGPGNVNQGIMFVRMEDADKRSRSTQEVIAELREKATSIVGTDVYFFMVNPLRQGSSTPLQIAIQSSDFERLVEFSQKLEIEVAKLPGLRDVEIDLEVDKPQLNVRIDREKAAALSISATDIADTLRVLLGGDDATRFRRGNELYDVIVQLEAADRFATSDPASIYVRSGASGGLLPLSNVVKVQESVGPSSSPSPLWLRTTSSTTSRPWASRAEPLSWTPYLRQ